MNRRPVLTLEAVRFRYEGAEAPALNELTLTVEEGERLAVVGPGGSGKSTLCRLVTGALASDPDAGRLEGRIRLRGAARVDGYTAAEAAGRIGSVSQDPETGLVLDVVEDELAFGPENMNVPPARIEERIDGALSAVGLPRALREARTAELSGGQQQRVAIAAALAMEPLLLVLDDAAANLDADGAATLAETLRTLHRGGATLIETSPRWEAAAEADRVAVLDGGRIVALGTPEDVLSRHASTVRRLGCLPAVGLEAGEDASGGACPASGPGPAEPAPDRGVVLEALGLRFAYPGSGGRLALRETNAVVRSGDVVGVVGANGAGKTTFGKLVAGLLPAPPESLRLLGRPVASYSVRELACTVGYVFQRPERQFVAETALEECAFGLRVARGGSFDAHPEDTARAEEALRAFGLGHALDAHPRALPVAEQRLLNLASALILQPALLVLDEPTAGLDYAATDRLLAQVATFAGRGGAALVITHDAYALRRFANRRLTFE